MKPDTAKVFMSGPSQAVRLPKRFRFPSGCSEVTVRRFGRHLVLGPRFESWEAYWSGSTRPYASLGTTLLALCARDAPGEDD
ncbi:MAG: AbrB/MazE/SpoVT family DNA-binding domain-containing protein [Gammaproteobacteria bacterium]|nr:AbrB/MazE/SpoVT family DNA-binding domain-containing protein [Gammaproteobacteria bacterium]